MTEGERRLIVIVGPTAVGKTELAIRVAKKLRGEIISADSRLFYRGMDIGTAKPDPVERKKVPHHLIDVVDPDETYSLAVFQREVERLTGEIRARGHLPMLVGGTGQYVLAVVEGWLLPAVKPMPVLRKALNSWAAEVGEQVLHDRLALIDPEAAAAIDARNLRRTVRALEVYFTTGVRFSAQRRKEVLQADRILVGLNRPRAELYARIDERIEQMIAGGLVDEVKQLIARGYSSDLPSMSAIGYQEIGKFIEGKISMEEAIVLMKRRTRKFVRRQAAWFKPADPRIHWFNVGDNTEIEVMDFIQQVLIHG
ncbi:MAG: tRNA (adenosine(37)-N6)-dimethylallyltransferase MiaA [Anaerolineaceae bacterium]